MAYLLNNWNHGRNCCTETIEIVCSHHKIDTFHWKGVDFLKRYLYFCPNEADHQEFPGVKALNDISLELNAGKILACTFS